MIEITAFAVFVCAMVVVWAAVVFFYYVGFHFSYSPFFMCVFFRMVLQETFVIEDCHYWNDGSSVTGLEIGTGVSCTSNGDYITITTSTSGEKYVWIPVTLANSDNWIYEVEIADTVTGSTNQPIAITYDNSSKWAGHSINGNQWFANSGVNDAYTQAYQIGDKLTIIRENGVDKAILNDNTIISNRTVSHNSTFKVGFYTNNGRVQKIKNIKVKAL